MKLWLVVLFIQILIALDQRSLPGTLEYPKSQILMSRRSAPSRRVFSSLMSLLATPWTGSEIKEGQRDWQNIGRAYTSLKACKFDMTKRR